MRWTRWRKIADQWLWYTDALSYDGPCCYELGTAGPRGGGIKRRYVGDTENERGRITDHAKQVSHLRPLIADYLSAGHTLYYRSIACATKAEAVTLQDVFLGRYCYDWNIVGAPCGVALSTALYRVGRLGAARRRWRLAPDDTL